MNQSISAVEFLLKSDKIDVSAQDNDGKSPLHIAARCGNPEIVSLFVASKNVKFNLQQSVKLIFVVFD